MLERGLGSVGEHAERNSLIDYARLEAVAAELRAAFESASPWQHVVIDNFFSDDVARKATDVYPRLDPAFRWLAVFLEARSYDGRLAKHDPFLHAIFNELHSNRFTKYIEGLTGIAPLHSDRELIGAGLHQGSRGSYLRVHADHNTHLNDCTRFRRVNVMIYLNDKWRPDWNGDLELWDREAKACRKRIAPVFNRCVILRVDDKAYHGYGPLRTPPGATRKALAAYYYSTSPDAMQDSNPHLTIWPPLEGERRLATFMHRLRRGIFGRLSRVLR